MKPIKLEIEGLNSFEDKQVLDFSKLGRGVFGIFGKTGSGKSTILDAITLALYGEVNRSKQNINFINTKRKRTVVSLEFEISGSGGNKTYFVSRTFNVKKNGVDVESSASLFEIVDGDKKLITEGTIKVNEKIFLIVGLGVNEFSKCIALPQGEFSAFLKSSPSERTKIMSNIFDLSKYGDPLVSRVKSKLAEYDKQVTSLSSSFELLQYASDENLEKVKTEFLASTKEYGIAREQLKEKSEQYAKISNDTQKKNKYAEVLAKLEKLEAESDAMKQLEEEISKNQSANSIKTDYEKLSKAHTDEIELSEKLSELHEIKLKSESELHDVQVEFDDFKSSYNDKLVELNTKLSKLDGLAKIENNLTELSAESEKIKEKIKQKNANLIEVKEKLNFILQNSSKIDEEIEKINDFIEANKPDVDLTYALEQTKGIESELILIDDIYKNLEALIDQTSSDLASVQEEYNSAIKEEKILNEKSEKIQNSIEVAFEDIDTTPFKKLRSCDNEIQGMQIAEVQIEGVDGIIDKLNSVIEQKKEKLNQINQQIEEAQNRLSESENKVLNQDVNLNKTREKREELLGENVISIMMNHLKVGDDCPVCGAEVIQTTRSETNNIKQIDSDINSKIMNLKALRFERDKDLEEVSRLRANYEFQRAEIETIFEEVNALKQSKEKIYQNFVDINDDTAENFEKLKNLLIKTADSLENLIIVQDELSEIKMRVVINKTTSGTKVTLYKNYLESLIDILYDLQKKKAEREFAIFNVNEKYKNLNAYKKQIAEGKSLEQIIDNKRAEKDNLRDRQHQLDKEKSQIEKEISEISSEIMVLTEKNDGVLKNINQLRANILAEGVPENVSVEDEKRAIFNEINRLKKDYENIQTKYESQKEFLGRTEKEYDFKTALLTQKRLEITKLENSVNAVIKENNFSGQNELESNFVGSLELKQKQTKLNDYSTELRVTTIQKQELETEGIVDVDETEVASLKEEIERLNASVQNYSEIVGKLSNEYERIEADNKKLNQIIEKLNKYKHKYDVAKELSNVLKGKALAEFVAEEYLQEITTVANQKLNLLMDGRYNLRFESGNFVVEDNFNDGVIRPANTLSGGETFLVSLSLAFAISEAISMLSSRNMEFFFLDEGFGTLDDELLEAVVSALYKLESQNLNIGLISHVAELEDTIKNRVYITKTNRGSVIKLEHSL